MIRHPPKSSLFPYTTLFRPPDGGHEGISAFVVEADSPGFDVARVEPKMGIKGSTTGELVFEDCRVPAANLLGEEGERSEEHTSELQSQSNLVCRLLLATKQA